jgi:O-succinylbenzoic acid--CoA ligase
VGVSTLSVLDAAREGARALAVVNGSRLIDFGELAERVRARMQALSVLDEDGSGSPSSSLVALCTDDSLDTLESVLALVELGRPFLPLHPRLTATEREQLLARLPVTWVIGVVPAGGHQVERRFPPRDDRARNLIASTPHLAALATSGSQGAARVALLSRRAFIASALASAANLGWRSDDRWLLCLPLAHIGGLSVVTRCLLARRPVVLVPEAPGQSSVQRLARAILQGAPSLLSVVPTQIAALLELEPAFEMPAHVRVMLTGGAAATSQLLVACAERGWPVLTSYGLTEACSQVATQEPGTVNRGELGVGRPLAGVSVRIEDGSIRIAGPTLLTAYLGDPGSAHVHDAAGFTTGDLGRFDAQGHLHVLGRSDDLIISGGENVSPGEVESVLAACPGVLAACVFPVPDPRWGQVVAAALRTHTEDVARLLSAVQQRAEQHLALFKRPRFYACVAEFAQGRTGKVDRRATALRLMDELRPAPRSGP